MANCSAERGEVEVDGDGVALAGRDFDGGGVGGKCGGREPEVDDGAGEKATTVGALVLGFAGEVIGGDLFVAVEDAVLKGAPEVGGTELNADGRAGPRMSRRGEDGAVGLCEQNFNLDFDNFVMGFVVESARWAL